MVTHAGSRCDDSRDRDRRGFVAGLWLRKAFGEDLHLDVVISRSEVCTRRVVGYEEVPETPAIPAHRREIVEWHCEGILEADPYAD